MLDKGAVIALPYGVEGFATPKHLVKEDGTQAQLEEKLPFKVIEFNKAKKAAKKAAKAENETAAINSNVEKTTLGDIEELAALKEKLESEKK